MVLFYRVSAISIKKRRKMKEKNHLQAAVSMEACIVV